MGQSVIPKCSFLPVVDWPVSEMELDQISAIT